MEIGCSHIFVKLQGREPDGVVAPDEDESVRHAVIDALVEGVSGPPHRGTTICVGRN